MIFATVEFQLSVIRQSKTTGSNVRITISDFLKEENPTTKARNSEVHTKRTKSVVYPARAGRAGQIVNFLCSLLVASVMNSLTYELFN
jgi:hypothetical protein